MPGKTPAASSGSAIVRPSAIAARVFMSAASITRLPAVLAQISRASRMGTPLEIMVPRVRLNRETATFLSSDPKTGIFNATASLR